MVADQRRVLALIIAACCTALLHVTLLLFAPLPPSPLPSLVPYSAVHLGASGAALPALKWKKSGSPQLRFADAGRRGPALLSQFAGA